MFGKFFPHAPIRKGIITNKKKPSSKHERFLVLSTYYPARPPPLLCTHRVIVPIPIQFLNGRIRFVQGVSPRCFQRHLSRISMYSVALFSIFFWSAHALNLSSSTNRFDYFRTRLLDREIIPMPTSNPRFMASSVIYNGFSKSRLRIFERIGRHTRRVKSLAIFFFCCTQ